MIELFILIAVIYGVSYGLRIYRHLPSASPDKK